MAKTYENPYRKADVERVQEPEPAPKPEPAKAPAKKAASKSK